MSDSIEGMIKIDDMYGKYSAKEQGKLQEAVSSLTKQLVELEESLCKKLQKIEDKQDTQFRKYDEVEKDVIRQQVDMTNIKCEIEKIRSDAKDALKEIWGAINGIKKMYIGLIITAGSGVIGALFTTILFVLRH